MITLSDYVLEVISKFPFLLLLVQIFRVPDPEYCSFLQLLLPSISFLPSQLTGKCLVSPPWMFLSHYVSTVHQSQHESCRQHVRCRDITTHRFRSLPRTLQSTIKYNQDCKSDILGTNSENTEVGFGHNTHDSSFSTG